jgi:cell division protein FtsL
LGRNARLVQLTVISKVSRINENRIKTKKANGGIFYLNISIIGLIMAGIFGYVFMANQIVSDKYSAKTLEERFDKANSTLEKDSAEINDSYSLDSLTAFAKSEGMIEATDTASYYQNVGVAMTANPNQ